MHYLGIDLAWGERNPTGVAVLDGGRRLLHVAAVRTDAEIATALAPYVIGGCLAGLDAPLVVTNPVGMRPAERALSADFRRFHAGTHPANTSKPEFAHGTRGARVCARLGLEPHVGALEVYPHAASVVLFGLDRILRYKAKPGRDLALLRAELLRLVDLVAGVVEGGPGLARLRADVVAAERKSQLRVVEDQVDAVLCAYVAWYAGHHPDRMTTYGDPVTGLGVAPARG